MTQVSNKLSNKPICVIITGSLTLKNCKIFGGRKVCAFVTGEDASLQAEDCSFQSRSGGGLQAKGNSNVNLTSCRIENCASNGVSAYNAQVDVLYSSIQNNAGCNVYLEEGAYADLYKSNFSGSHFNQGVHVGGEDTDALISACNISNNFASNVAVEDGASCTLQGGTYGGSKNRKGFWVDGEGSKLVASNSNAFNNKEGDLVSRGGACVELWECNIGTMDLGNLITLDN